MRWPGPRRTSPVLLTILLALGAGWSAHADPDAEPRPGMVVVAPRRFHGALREFQAYRSAGRPTELAALEAILQETDGVDDPERLKRWLYRAWRERGVGYALLVGDADVVPVRYMVLDRVTPAAFDYAFYPSDLYYADVARRDGGFDDWNARSDGVHAGYFGEVRGEKNKADPINFDRVDYRPELAVGRWPVDSAAKVRIVAEKTMAYERG
ncbi:MAG TPA: C25 family cysteine peptidase, partial [Isosphaeraceae bacterium]